MKEEKQRLDDIAVASTYGTGLNHDSVEYSFRIFSRFLRGDSVLELGPAEGIMTEKLVATGKRITVVEGGHEFIVSLRERFPKATVVESLFEEFVPETLFDNIVLGHVLEHVDRPVEILQRVRSWLAPGGRVLAAVPNARSLHRQAAVLMGLLPREDALNEADIRHGHRRVYFPEAFRGDFVASGLRIEAFGGYWLKPLSNRQLEETWTTEMVRTFMELGERYPDIAAESYVVACHSEQM